MAKQIFLDISSDGGDDRIATIGYQTSTHWPEGLEREMRALHNKMNQDEGDAARVAELRPVVGAVVVDGWWAHITTTRPQRRNLVANTFALTSRDIEKITAAVEGLRVTYAAQRVTLGDLYDSIEY